jgi:hypothetical protein
MGGEQVCKFDVPVTSGYAYMTVQSELLVNLLLFHHVYQLQWIAPLDCCTRML